MVDDYPPSALTLLDGIKPTRKRPRGFIEDERPQDRAPLYKGDRQADNQPEDEIQAAPSENNGR